ncbi:hypothetical protein Agabi119p4_11544 [Agaricus bisporus var. burnettii]|uniref:MYND-type domain-containing protein n=1 Tax=Agaricus bisporus var. burnettii TaxID=192524 RepID=A0A8H7EUU4_AGABI|nr:hypothetical protein Agabi119p4_11544 [Agaricus bisporus var. burnettii]
MYAVPPTRVMPQDSGSKQGSLKLCQRCERALYCSSECQKTHWPTHKKHCVNSEYEASLQWNDMIIAASGKFGTPGLPVPPPGLTWQDLHKRFKKWFSFHMMTLFAVSIHSLQLPQDRAPTHILLIQIEYHNGSTEVAKHFKLNHTKVITLDEATDMAGPPMQTFREERKDHEGRVILAKNPFPGYRGYRIAQRFWKTVSTMANDSNAHDYCENISLYSKFYTFGVWYDAQPASSSVSPPDLVFVFFRNFFSFNLSHMKCVLVASCRITPIVVLVLITLTENFDSTRWRKLARLGC